MRDTSPLLLADIGGTNARFALDCGDGRVERIATLSCAEERKANLPAGGWPTYGDRPGAPVSSRPATANSSAPSSRSTSIGPRSPSAPSAGESPGWPVPPRYPTGTARTRTTDPLSPSRAGSPGPARHGATWSAGANIGARAGTGRNRCSGKRGGASGGAPSRPSSAAGAAGMRATMPGIAAATGITSCATTASATSTVILTPVIVEEHTLVTVSDRSALSTVWSSGRCSLLRVRPGRQVRLCAFRKLVPPAGAVDVAFEPRFQAGRVDVPGQIGISRVRPLGGGPPASSAPEPAGNPVVVFGRASAPCLDDVAGPQRCAAPSPPR